MRDYYDEVIREHSDAAAIMADLCRKKDAAISLLEARIKELEDEVTSLRISLRVERVSVREPSVRMVEFLLGED